MGIILSLYPYKFSSLQLGARIGFFFFLIFKLHQCRLKNSEIKSTSKKSHSRATQGL